MTTSSTNQLSMVLDSVNRFDVANMHNHHVGTIPIFSYVDIVTHYDNYNFVNDSRKNEYTSYLVCFNNTTYALRLENMSALSTLFAGLNLETDSGKKEAQNKILKIFNDYGLDESQEYTQAMAEELFVNVLSDEKLGSGTAISLYRKDEMNGVNL